jgi:glycosyltransferase involved in cell wall biosynthesis
MNFANVSVIIPCYRCPKTIGRAVDSVLKQTMLPREIILVDDFSNDNGATLGALSAIRESNSHTLIAVIALEKNGGPGTARNIGWSKASQPYIAFLDADDSWHPKKLEIQYEWMRTHPNIDLCAHPSLNLTRLTMPEFTDVFVAKPVKLDDLIRSNYLPCRSVMLKSKIAERFIDGKRQAEDYLLWLTLGFQGKQIWYLNLPLAYSFKEDFGQDGLNADLLASYQGILDTYQRIYQNGYISFIRYNLLLVLSFLKHCRRKLIFWFRA